MECSRLAAPAYSRREVEDRLGPADKFGSSGDRRDPAGGTDDWDPSCAFRSLLPGRGCMTS